MSLPVPLDTRAPSPKQCTNCGYELVDVYCARCGERQPDHHDTTAGHFFHELLHELVHLDSKLFRTLRDLIAKPGFLTTEYFAGRKTRYITPLRLYITLFALQLLAYSMYKPVAFYSVEMLAKSDARGNMTRVLDKLAEKKNTTRAEIIERMDVRWQKSVSFLQLGNVLGMALFMKLFYLRRRRNLGEHLVFSAHYLSFVNLLSLLLWPAYYVLGVGMSLEQQSVAGIATVVGLVYLYFAIARFYAQSRARNFVKMLLSYVSMYLVAGVLYCAALVIAMWQVAR